MRKKFPTRRRASIFLAALSVLVMSSGAALMATASPATAAAGPNDPDYWETLANETCTKTDEGAESGGFTVPAAPDGAVWSKLILKKGSGNIGVENQVFNDPVPGQTYTWQGFNDQQDGGWSHYILCQVPEDEPEVVEPGVTWTEPDCENDNSPSWSGANNEHIGYAVTDGSVSPGAFVEVTATAESGYVFADQSTEKVFTHTYDEAEAPCVIVNPPKQVTPAVSFVDATCDTDPAVILPEPTPPVEVEPPSRQAAGPVIQAADIDGVHYEVSGELVPGGTVEVDATPLQGFEFPQGATTHWSHTFPELTDCAKVEPPVVDTPESDTETPVATPTVVSAGLETDLRGQQGLALLVAGAIGLVLAGSIGLARPRRVTEG